MTQLITLDNSWILLFKSEIFKISFNGIPFQENKKLKSSFTPWNMMNQIHSSKKSTQSKAQLSLFSIISDSKKELISKAKQLKNLFEKTKYKSCQKLSWVSHYLWISRCNTFLLFTSLFNFTLWKMLFNVLTILTKRRNSQTCKLEILTCLWLSLKMNTNLKRKLIIICRLRFIDLLLEVFFWLKKRNHWIFLVLFMELTTYGLIILIIRDWQL